MSKKTKGKKDIFYRDLIGAISISNEKASRDAFLFTAIQERSTEMLVELASDVECAAYWIAHKDKTECANALSVAGALYFMGYQISEAQNVLDQAKRLIQRCDLDLDKLKLVYLMRQAIQVDPNPQNWEQAFVLGQTKGDDK